MDEEKPNKIRERRQSLGLSLAQAARIIGTTKQTLGRVETGRSDVSLDKLRLIANGLRCDIADLLLGTDNPYALDEHERRIIDGYRSLDAANQSRFEILAQTVTAVLRIGDGGDDSDGESQVAA